MVGSECHSLELPKIPNTSKHVSGTTIQNAYNTHMRTATDKYGLDRHIYIFPEEDNSQIIYTLSQSLWCELHDIAAACTELSSFHILLQQHVTHLNLLASIKACWQHSHNATTWSKSYGIIDRACLGIPKQCIVGYSLTCPIWKLFLTSPWFN